MSHILARVKELRPVLPRPARSSPPNGGPIHELSSGMPHSIPNRHHMYDHVMFSPYGRAHDRTHDHPLGHEKQNLMGLPTSYLLDGMYERPGLESAASGSQAERLMSIGRFSFTSACTCGDPLWLYGLRAEQVRQHSRSRYELHIKHLSNVPRVFLLQPFIILGYPTTSRPTCCD
ncbi:hypothetical protein F5887DRAFT_12852 [Amanita rubescens]|nr:hypothetical protein F5887DRAFT_12852 [Amanita rubescens]